MQDDIGIASETTFDQWRRISVSGGYVCHMSHGRLILIDYLSFHQARAEQASGKKLTQLHEELSEERDPVDEGVDETEDQERRSNMY